MGVIQLNLGVNNDQIRLNKKMRKKIYYVFELKQK